MQQKAKAYEERSKPEVILSSREVDNVNFEKSRGNTLLTFTSRTGRIFLWRSNAKKILVHSHSAVFHLLTARIKINFLLVSKLLHLINLGLISRWVPIDFDGFWLFLHRFYWIWMDCNRFQLISMDLDGFQWILILCLRANNPSKSIKINQNQSKSIKITWNQWKINQNPVRQKTSEKLM